MTNRYAGHMSPTPVLILSMWGAGLAAGSGAVASWQVVGPGFVWLSGGVATVLALLAALAGGGAWAWIGTALVLAGFAAAGRPRVSSLLLGAGAVSVLTTAIDHSTVLSALTGSVFLGGVTSAMIIGHWYLVDPRMPRWAMRRLDGAAALGLVGEAIVLGAAGAFRWEPSSALIGWAFLALLALTALLLLGVWLSLRESSYAGVMAATGLGYLGVVSSLALVVAGRSLASA